MYKFLLRKIVESTVKLKILHHRQSSDKGKGLAHIAYSTPCRYGKFSGSWLGQADNHPYKSGFSGTVGAENSYYFPSPG